MLPLNKSEKELKQSENRTILEKYCSSCNSLTKTIINYDDCSATCSICGEKTIVPALQYRKSKQFI